MHPCLLLVPAIHVLAAHGLLTGLAPLDFVEVRALILDCALVAGLDQVPNERVPEEVVPHLGILHHDG